MRVNISKQDKPVNKKISGWDKAINAARANISRLETAINHFEDMKKTGQPWPEDQQLSPTQN